MLEPGVCAGYLTANGIEHLPNNTRFSHRLRVDTIKTDLAHNRAARVGDNEIGGMRMKIHLPTSVSEPMNKARH